MSQHDTYQLSVIIVNYNVRYFLDQCLDSVRKAITQVRTEVLIVDNCSVDGSEEMVRRKYPEFTYIANTENVGFSRANNQAIRISKGKYVLLLNPDTVVAEDTFEKVIGFMDAHPDAGGLGIHMVDGRGNFLPESKRGLPRPMVAFYKIFGLSSLFPKSARFSRYHLGHLSPAENHTIDVLSGAFMLMRKEALDKVGLLDEDFFMYGEDIDLSYRIQLGGYRNYYYADSSIIHYKGESTKKSSVNYVFVFYNAMIIFARKHFSGKQARLFSFLINLAIYLRAFMAIAIRFVKRIFLPLVDFAYVVTGLFALTHWWQKAQIDFPEALIRYSIPIYAATWLVSTFLNGGYDTPIRLFKFLKGVFAGTLLILLAYAILPKDWQFSRLFIFIGAGWVLLYYLISRLFLHFAIGKRFRFISSERKRFGVIGSAEEFVRVKTLIEQTNDNVREIVYLGDDIPAGGRQYDEIVFCSRDLSFGTIISGMQHFRASHPDFKIAPEASDYLIGSNSIDTAGDLYILNLNNLLSLENKRKKRLFDICMSTAIFLASPVLMLRFPDKKKFLRNILSVWLGKKTFVGFSEAELQRDVRLPKIKPGVLSPADRIEGAEESIREKLNLLYSRDYSLRKDFSILLKAWGKLDR